MGETDVAAGPAEPAQDGERRPWTNFGGNQAFEAKFHQPQNEEEVLALLARHREDRIRALGAGHSWSEVATGCRRRARHERGSPRCAPSSATARALPKSAPAAVSARSSTGCTRPGDVTLPTLGAITRQTISGAISTGTHGSGKPGLSHFVTAVRVATYDAAGQPAIVTYRDGDELKAARCALGCMGVILSVELSTVRDYLVEETVRRYRDPRRPPRRHARASADPVHPAALRLDLRGVGAPRARRTQPRPSPSDSSRASFAPSTRSSSTWCFISASRRRFALGDSRSRRSCGCAPSLHHRRSPTWTTPRTC